MKVGVFVPLVGDPASLPETLAVAATTAEAAGFHSLWFAEHVVLFDAHRSRYPYSEDGAFPIAGEDGLLEPFVAIAYAAAITSRIRLGTGVCLVPQRSAIYTAKQVADCDVLSRGRVDFGVGIGWLRPRPVVSGSSLAAPLAASQPAFIARARASVFVCAHTSPHMAAALMCPCDQQLSSCLEPDTALRPCSTFRFPLALPSRARGARCVAGL